MLFHKTNKVLKPIKIVNKGPIADGISSVSDLSSFDYGPEFGTRVLITNNLIKITDVKLFYISWIENSNLLILRPP
jgi:hypothetical protein